jgi:diguanylate cyclase (GGDEF)-like protein/PAS domain S-box-containing protein
VGPRSVAWLGAALAALGFGLVVNLAPDGDLAVVVDDIGTTAVAALAGASCLLAYRKSRPDGAEAARRRRGWLLVGLGVLSWSAGNAIWAVYELGAHQDAPFPSLADVGYLGFVPLALAGVVLLGPSFARVGTVKRVMDIILITVGLGGVGWTLVLAPVAATTNGALEEGLSLAYPIGDLLMLAAILSVITITRRGDRALAVLLAGLVLFASADVSFAYMTATDQYSSGGITAWAWFCGFLLIALAARPAQPTELADDLDGVHTRWLTELVIHFPVVSVGALAVVERVTGGEVSNGTIALILVVFVLNALRHAAASRQMAGLTGALAEQLSALQTERRRSDLVIDEARDPYVELDPDGRVLVWNGPAEAVFGWSRDHMVGRLIADIVPEDNREASRLRMEEFIASSDASVWDEGVDVRYLRPDGTEVPIEIAAWSTGEGAALRVHAFVWDISERLAEHELLEASEKKWQSLVSHASDMTIVLDREGRVDQEVPTVRQLFGYADNENHGRHFADLIHPQDLQRAIDRFTRVLAEPGNQERERVRIRRFDGSWVHVDAIATNLLDEPTVAGIVCNLRDISEQVAAENELKRQARRDPLTGLPNRNLMTNALARHCAEEHDGHAALLLMDLDGFKDINDGLGHDVGDQLLVEIGHRLDRVTRADDVVARLGGDEFAVLVTRLPALGHAAAIAENLGNLIREPVRLGDVTLEVGVSIGIADCSPGDDPLAVLQRADVAMYRAKRERSGHAVYGSGDDEERRNSVKVAADLRQAIDRGDLVVHYQPKIELSTGLVDSVEALVRWQHPTRGLLPPDEFIALAERTGLIRDLTTWVLGTALRQCATWRAEGLDLPVAVNLSPRVLGQSDLVAGVREALEANGVPAGRLTLEITESAFPENGRLLSSTLDALGRLGVRLSVDDFGTGWSSLSKLKEMPVQELKIDRTFVFALAEDATDHSIVRSVLELARSLGLTVVAEGVETEEVLDLLRELDCPLVQGYLFSRPVPGHELTGWILERDHQRRTTGSTDAEDSFPH